MAPILHFNKARPVTELPDENQPTKKWPVIALRARWKPTKNRLVDADENQDLCIRVHRSLSWMARVEELEAVGAEAEPQPNPAFGPDPTTAWYDDALVMRWIGFNSLYGIWDEERKEPARDLESCTEFIKRVVDLDADEVIGDTLTEHRDLVMSILDDGFLDRYFWKSPGEEKLRKAQNAVRKGERLYAEGRLFVLTDFVVRRIYNLRCQMVHGAASRGGTINRESAQRCADLLGHLMPAFLRVVIDHGAEMDWGPLCYPPIALESSA
jgi:hypothetical protein